MAARQSDRSEPRHVALQFFQEPYYVAISADQARREVPLRRLEVIHHGLDASCYEWTDTSHDYVCFIGRFAQVKGPHTAIDVAARAGIPIRVAGETHDVDREFSAREVQPRLEQPHVTFLGGIGLAEKVPLLRGARALVAPSEWDEPFGLVLSEAMLSGCPVMAFPRGSVPELVENGVTGFVVRNPEEMADVIRTGGAAERFDRRRCRERAVQRFSRSRMVEAYERLYERVIKQTARFASTRGSLLVWGDPGERWRQFEQGQARTPLVGSLPAAWWLGASLARGLTASCEWCGRARR